MNKTETEFNQVNRTYKIKSKELKSQLSIEGEIVSIVLYAGRSPSDIINKLSADNDVWEISTEETLETASK